MPEPANQRSSAVDLLRGVDVAWDVDTWNDLYATTVKRGRRRERARRIATRGTALVMLLVAGAFGVRAWTNRSAELADARTTSDTSTSALPGAALRTLRFGDGSTVTLLSSASTLGPKEVTATRTEVELHSGSARFEVARRPERTFRVTSGDVSVEVLGTVFALDRVGTRTRVSVESGAVRVAWAGETRMLGAGETGVFPPEAAAEAPPAEAPAPEPPPAPPVRKAAASALAWRQLARANDYDAAWRLLGRAAGAPGDDVRDEPGDLLLAADVARLSGHPAQAVPYLRRLVARHPDDPRASAAAFTLGRVLLEDAGDARAAAAAFADTQRLSPDGVLAEDALVRQIEATLLTGDKAAAQRLAARYRAEYPEGRRRRSVQRLLGE